MLARLVTTLVRIITDTFFRSIDVAGLENVPAAGPVIFAGNHPNALMDGWLLTAKCGRRPLYFLADAKLWNYGLLRPFLDATGAVPVYRRDAHGEEVDNEKAFSRVFELLESGDCVGIFPEGISHVESQLVKLKTGTARIALSIAARGKARVPIVPCGLNYIHRHRFRSRVYIEFGPPLMIDDDCLARYREDPQETVLALTGRLAEALQSITVNAPDWRTLRIIQSARRLYKPAAARLTPGQYVELNRRFVTQYLKARDDPELQSLTTAIEDYQARLDLLGLKDHQLRQPVTLSGALRKLLLRTLTMIVLLPLALPGALLHLPVGWAAAMVGEQFSYEQDDVATLKVFATILLLPLIYVAVAIAVGMSFGMIWGLVLFLVLPFSFFASVQLIEVEAGLLMSVHSILRLTRLGREVDELRAARADLVRRIRERVEQHVTPGVQRIFTAQDFADGGTPSD